MRGYPSTKRTQLRRWRKDRTTLQYHLAQYANGTAVPLAAHQDGHPLETAEQHIASIKRRIADLDVLIAGAEDA